MLNKYKETKMANKKLCKTCKAENDEKAVACIKCGSKELVVKRVQSTFLDECAG